MACVLIESVFEWCQKCRGDGNSITCVAACLNIEGIRGYMEPITVTKEAVEELIGFKVHPMVYEVVVGELNGKTVPKAPSAPSRRAPSVEP
ncbi:hypothetical protein [Pyrobaculum aerophilum]|uniref:Uncharacterized protein n=1 Tax=Pyrobaculum aerophilum TaxID=13773 RepID=A0A371QZK9_9CREN|nr:hypothetical protein [Pyrobaculum aerophilum]RFA96184.1 hypothetical protein CGL51_05840 [Pyrobaculum aerophilum]